MTTTIILISIILICLYIIINQQFKLKKLLGMVTEEYSSSDLLVTKLLKLFIEAKATLSKIDKNGAFSTDDEVGFAFKLINSVIIELSFKLQELTNIINEESGDDTKGE